MQFIFEVMYVLIIGIAYGFIGIVAAAIWLDHATPKRIEHQYQIESWISYGKMSPTHRLVVDGIRRTTILIQVLWPLALIGAILFGIWKLSEGLGQFATDICKSMIDRSKEGTWNLSLDLMAWARRVYGGRRG